MDAQYEYASGLPICWTLYDSDLGDTEGAAGSADDGAITSAATFDQWFRDVPGVNMFMPYTVLGVMQDSGPYAGMYEINYPSFYPVDGKLLGNDSTHNNYFTFEAEAVHLDPLLGRALHAAEIDHELSVDVDPHVVITLEHQLVVGG